MFAEILSLFADFFTPTKRVFVGYLAISAIIALIWLCFVQRNSLRQSLKRLFDKEVFWSKSSRADYKIFLINQIISIFTSQILITQLAIATAIYFALHKQGIIARGVFDHWPVWIIVTLYSAAMFIVDDLSKYLLHRWMHRFPLLWAMHKTHHSAETLTPVTVYRVHPLEGILYALRGACAQGLVIPIFLFAFGGAVSLITVLGVNVLVFMFHVTGSNLRHSHIDIRYWPWLEHILISPAQHQLHHSIADEHHDKNFGAALAIWDWLFGSLHLSERDKDLTFGLGPDESSATDLWDIYTRPFLDIGRYFKRRARRMYRFVTNVNDS